MYDSSILIEISPSLAGFRRVVAYEGIQEKSMTRKFARIIWYVIQLDEKGEIAKHPDINAFRRVDTDISDENRVTDQGYLIEDRSSELWQSGHPEFTFWWSLLHTQPLPTVLKQAAAILDSFNRFDRY